MGLKFLCIGITEVQDKTKLVGVALHAVGDVCKLVKQGIMASHVKLFASPVYVVLVHKVV